MLPHDKTFIDKFLSKSVLHFSDFFIVHSQQDKEDLLSMIPNARVIKSVHPTYEIFNYKCLPKIKARKLFGHKRGYNLVFWFYKEI